MFAVSLIPFSKQIFEVSFLSSLFWVVFTLSYQIPGIVYYINRLAKKNTLGKTLELLSKRENEVALEICNGLKYGEIAEKLFISISSVKKHANSIYKKLEIKNNRELLHIFVEYNNNAHNKPVS
jgi:DNA-binding NarL/FixJ family response regulator